MYVDDQGMWQPVLIAEESNKELGPIQFLKPLNDPSETVYSASAKAHVFGEVTSLHNPKFNKNNTRMGFWRPGDFVQ